MYIYHVRSSFIHVILLISNAQTFLAEIHLCTSVREIKINSQQSYIESEKVNSKYPQNYILRILHMYLVISAPFPFQSYRNNAKFVPKLAFYLRQITKKCCQKHEKGG